MKILVAIANHGTKNDHFARQLLDEYAAMDHEVDVVVLSNIEKDWGPDVEVRVGAPTPNPWSLPFGHKALFEERRGDYDLFIYTEDDTLVTQRNVDAYREVCASLPDDRIPGFLRYEEHPNGDPSYCSIHSHFRWTPDSVEEHGGETFAHFTNEHSACFLLTRDQLDRAIASGGFLVEAHEGRHDMLCSAATDPYTACGMKRVICVSRLEDFFFAHLPNVYLGRFGITTAELEVQRAAIESIRRGEASTAHEFPVETNIRHALWSRNCYEGRSEDVERVVPATARTVLSVGCGTGGPEEGLRDRGAEVTAVPLDAVFGRMAEARGIEVLDPSLEVALESLGDRRFDVVLLRDVLHLHPDPVGVLERCSRVVAEGGTIVFSTPNFDYLPLRYHRLRGRPGFDELADSDSRGVSLTGKRLTSRWCRDAGLGPATFPFRVEDRFRTHHRLLLGLLPSWFSKLLWTTVHPAPTPSRARETAPSNA